MRLCFFVRIPLSKLQETLFGKMGAGESPNTKQYQLFMYCFLFQVILLFKFTITQSQYIFDPMSHTPTHHSKNKPKNLPSSLNSPPKTQSKTPSNSGPQHLPNQTKSSSVTQKKVVKPRSLKQRLNNLQISFELNFMDEHEQVFDSWFKKLLEQTLKKVNPEDFCISLSAAFGRKMEITRHSNVTNKFLSAQEFEQFRCDLVYEEKLRKFLKLITQKVPKQLTEQFIFLTFLCWEKYIEVRAPILPSHKLLEIAEKFSEEVCEKDEEELGLKFLNFKQAKESEIVGPEKRREIFIKFMRVYFGTVFFIIEEYFENPFKVREQGEDRLNLQHDSLFSRDFEFAFPEDAEFGGPPTKKFKYE